MILTELFNGTTLISVLLILFIGGLLYLYLSYKISQQDHKFSSMLGLVSTFADELSLLKNKVANANMSGLGGGSGNYEGIDRTHTIHLNQQSLIQVSDNEVDSDDDTNDDESGESESEASNNDDDEESDLEEHEIEDIIDISDNTFNKTITIFNLDNNTHEIDEDVKEDDEVDEDDNEDNSESLSSYDEMESIDASVQSSFTKAPSTNQIKKISLDLEHSSHDLIFDNLTVHLHEEVEVSNDVHDLKKMPIGKLRTLVVEKGHKEDISKLKKTDLLKLLNVE